MSLRKLRSASKIGKITWPNILNFLTHEINSLPEGSLLLDAGAGQQKLREYCSNLRYVSQDFCEYDGIGDGRGLHEGYWDTKNIDIISDICSIPVPSGTFDAVVCTEVLEHVLDPISAVNELFRVTKKGGVLVLTVPSFSAVHFAPQHYYTGFTRYFWERVLDQAGYFKFEIRESGNILSVAAESLSMIKGSLLAEADQIPGYFSARILKAFCYALVLEVARIVLGLANHLQFACFENKLLACNTIFVKAYK